MFKFFKRFPIKIEKGYQTYQLWPNRIEIIEGKQGQESKFNIIKPILDKHLAGKSVLDIGTSNGFYAFYSAVNGAKQVVGLDKEDTKIGGIDLSHLRKISKKCEINNIDFVSQDFTDYHHTIFNTVLCFALIHHLYYASTERFRSLSFLIQYISDFTSEVLLIEWVDVRGGGPYQTQKPYKKSDFIRQLNKQFKKVNFVGLTQEYSNTNRPPRELYECIK